MNVEYANLGMLQTRRAYEDTLFFQSLDHSRMGRDKSAGWKVNAFL